MKQAERECHDPGMPDGETRLAAPRANDLRAEKQNRQRDGGVERRHGKVRIAQRRNRQCDAVGERERGDRLHQHPRRAHEEQQSEHEQQMVDAKQDVLDALCQKCEGRCRRPRGACSAGRVAPLARSTGCRRPRCWPVRGGRPARR